MHHIFRLQGTLSSTQAATTLHLLINELSKSCTTERVISGSSKSEGGNKSIGFHMSSTFSTGIQQITKLALFTIEWFIFVFLCKEKEAHFVIRIWLSSEKLLLPIKATHPLTFKYGDKKRIHTKIIIHLWMVYKNTTQFTIWYTNRFSRNRKFKIFNQLKTLIRLFP